MKDHDKTFDICQPLMYIIQQTTGQPTETILYEIKKMADEIVSSSRSKGEWDGTKDIVGFWPGTDIQFRIKIHCYGDDAQCRFDMPLKTKHFSGDTIEGMVAEAALLDKELPKITRPTVRTPRGMKKMQ